MDPYEQKERMYEKGRGPGEYGPEQALGAYQMSVIEANDYGALDDTDCGVDRIVTGEQLWIDPELDDKDIADLLKGFEDIEDPLEPSIKA